MNADSSIAGPALAAIPGLRPVNIVRAEPPSADVARALIDDILSGQVGPGEKLPSVRQLSGSGYGRELGGPYGIREFVDVETGWIGPAR